MSANLSSFDNLQINPGQYDASHVIVGLILLALVLILSLRGDVKPAHAEHIEMISWYWHFVDAVWVVVFSVVYVIGR